LKLQIKRYLYEIITEYHLQSSAILVLGARQVGGIILEGSFGLLPIEIKYGTTVDDADIRPLRQFMRENKLTRGLKVGSKIPLLRLGILGHLLRYPRRKCSRAYKASSALALSGASHIA
jgi:hypothetical protein